MTATYEAIATASGGSTTITFSSIPSTYTDLIIVMQITTPSFIGVKLTLNSDTGTNYSKTGIYGDGASAASFRDTNGTNINIVNSGTSVNMAIVQLMNYSNTTTYKTGLIRRSEPTSLTEADVFLWRNTSAINRVDLTSTTSFDSSSTFTLYGIKAE